MSTIKIIGTRLYQWEVGRQLQIIPLLNHTVASVHFSNPGDSEALVVKPKKADGMIVADIPNILLQSGKNLVVHTVDVSETYAETLVDYELHVRRRAKPSDYVYTEVEILNYSSLSKRIDDMESEGLAKAVENYLKENPAQAGATKEEAEQIQQNKEDIERLENEKLSTDVLNTAIDTALTQAKETGLFDGKDGHTPVKGVDYFDGQDGKNGIDGKDGKDGYTPVKGVDYFDGRDGEDGVSPTVAVVSVSGGYRVTITDKNGTNTVDLVNGKDGYTPVKGVDYFDGQPGKDGYTPQKNVDYFDGKDGKDGKDGQNGQDGKTPVKGEDYYTEADKVEMVEEVLKKIPEPDGFDPALYGLPVLYLTGDTTGMSKENAVPLNYAYGERNGECTLKWQGASSIGYPKKNYTIKFDNAFEAAEGWGAQKKYCLKANWIDHSHARNVVSAKIWGETVKSRAIENTKLSALPNGGAVDGFPCIIMLNGDFHGLYTFNIPKDGWMYGMGNPDEEFQTEILPYKTYLDAPVSVDSTYTPVNGIKTYFITTTGTLSGGRTYVNWDTTQITTFGVRAWLYNEDGELCKVFCEHDGKKLSPYYGKSGDFGEDAWYDVPLTYAGLFYVSAPISLPVPSGYYVMWELGVVNTKCPEGSELTPSYSAEADANNTWTNRWVMTGVEFSIRSNERYEAIVCADALTESTKFKDLATFAGDFEIEYSDENISDDMVKSSLNRLITACIDSDGTNLDTEIAKYLDWDSAIDYYIYACLIGAADACAKNYLLFTYDGRKWSFGAYDLDTTFGIWWNGQRFLPSDHYPTVQWYANYHRVMGLILNYKKQQFKARYAELRAGALSENNVALTFSNFVSKIPSTVYTEDAKKWPTIPSTSVSNLNQILNWYRLRVAVIDREMESL